MITASNQIVSIDEKTIESSISNILAAYGTDERAFQMASMTYNSVFFRDLPDEFVARVCAALCSHFVNNSNEFWKLKARSDLTGI